MYVLSLLETVWAGLLFLRISPSITGHWSHHSTEHHGEYYRLVLWLPFTKHKTRPYYLLVGLTATFRLNNKQFDKHDTDNSVDDNNVTP